MANLSNINNKFLVTTGGNILIGQTSAVGSSILQVTGNSTFAGDVTLNGEIYGRTSAAYPGLGGLGFYSLVPYLENANQGGLKIQVQAGASLVDALTLDSSKNATFAGNVLVGSGTIDNPQGWGKILQVQNSGANGASLSVKDSNNEWNLATYNNYFYISDNVEERLTIDVNGNVGIGTTSPGRELTVEGAGNVYIRIQSRTDNDSTALELQNTQHLWTIANDDTNNDALEFRSGGVGTPMVIEKGGNVGIGTTAPDSILHVKGDMVTIEDPSGGFKMELSADNNPVTIRSDNRTGASYGSMAFVAGNGSDANDITRMTIDTSGNVGIGNINPQYPLHFGSEGGYHISIGAGNTAPGGNTPWFGVFNNNSIASATYGWGIYDSSTDGSFQIWNRTGNTTGYNTFTIKRGGNVGIGTSSPASSYGFSRTLEIQGAVNAEINISQSNNGKDWSLGIVNGANYQQTTSGQDYIWLIGGSEKMRITSGGNVGIGTTTPYSLLDVNGVITNRTASQDPNFTVAVVGGIGTLDGGSLQFTQGFGGTSAAGDTVVFRYNATSWKSWSLDYTFASYNQLIKGTIGGYSNNSMDSTNAFLSNTANATVVATNSGQNVIVTFTGNFGIHMMCDMRYSQGGGDGSPRATRASLTFNS